MVSTQWERNFQAGFSKHVSVFNTIQSPFPIKAKPNWKKSAFPFFLEEPKMSCCVLNTGLAKKFFFVGEHVAQ